MKVKVFLLAAAAAVALLGRPVTTSPVHHDSRGILGKVIDLISSYKKSPTVWNPFLEDVKHLTDNNKCQEKFFCKVNDILQANLSKGEGEKLARTLQSFIDARIPNCTELQRNMTSTDVKQPVLILLENLRKCSQSWMLRRKESIP